MSAKWNMTHGTGAIFFDDLEKSLQPNDFTRDIAEIFCERFDKELPDMQFVHSSCDFVQEEVDIDCNYTSWGTKISSGHISEFEVNDGIISYAELVVTFRLLNPESFRMRRVHCIIDLFDTNKNNVKNMVQSETFV